MVTPEMKDVVLNVLCSSGLEYEREYSLSKQSFIDEVKQSMNENELVGILSQFNRIGFIDNFANSMTSLRVLLKVEATDFFNRGGFVAQEKMLKDNIIKLEKEISLLAKELKPKSLEKANFIALLGSAIVGAIGMMK
jgi:hypothetical protein